MYTHIFNPYLYSKLMVVSYTKISRDTQHKYSHSNFIMTHIPQKNLNPLVRYQNYIEVSDQNQTKFSHCVIPNSLEQAH